MEKQLEVFDVVANSQKQVFNNLLNLQNDMSAQWMDAVNKTHAALTSLPGMPETAQTKEALNQFNSWFGAVAGNAQVAGETLVKAQKSWISSYEKQLAATRSTLKSAIEISSPTAQKAA